VRVRPPQDIQPKALKMLVSGATQAVTTREGLVQFEVKSILDHEVVVLES